LTNRPAVDRPPTPAPAVVDLRVEPPVAEAAPPWAAPLAADASTGETGFEPPHHESAGPRAAERASGSTAPASGSTASTPKTGESAIDPRLVAESAPEAYELPEIIVTMAEDSVPIESEVSSEAQDTPAPASPEVVDMRVTTAAPVAGAAAAADRAALAADRAALADTALMAAAPLTGPVPQDPLAGPAPQGQPTGPAPQEPPSAQDWLSTALRPDFAAPAPPDESPTAPRPEAETAIMQAPAAVGAPTHAIPAAPGGPQGPKPPKAKSPRSGSTGPGRPRRARLVVVACLVVALIVGVVGSGVFATYYYGDRAMPGVTLAGQGVAGQTAAQLDDTVTGLEQGLTLNITSAGKTVQASADDLGVVIDKGRSVTAALDEGRGTSLWKAYNPFVAKPAPVALDVDGDKLRAYLADQFVNASEAAVDATVAYDEATGQFAVQPGHEGVTVDPSPVLDLLESYAIGHTELTPVTVETEVDPPQIGDAAAAASAAQANARLGLTIVLHNGLSGSGERSYQIPAASIASWTTVEAHPAQGEIAIGVDTAKMTAELPPLLTEQLAVPMRPQTEVNIPGMDHVGVIEWGLDGTQVADPGPALAEVAAALAEGRDATIAVAVVDEPFTTITQNPPNNYGDPNGAKWIDINKSNFTVTLYEGTTFIRSFYVSIGAGGKYETSDGTFYIYIKYEHQVMRGPASDPYESPTDWVAYFNNDIAFHSAPWNEPNGWGRRVSHGCVNMKTVDAKALWDWAPYGTKVEVHY
jgi:lipoprotein-anchoring transpeptidase ErfK/SrfK